MRAKFDWRLITVALLAGASIGFAGSRIAYRLRLLHPPIEEPFQRLSNELKLTDFQRQRAGEAVHQAREQIREAQREFEQKRRDLLVSAYLKIRASLQPEQQQLLDRDFVPLAIRLQGQATVEAQNHTAMRPASAATKTSP
ncbi:MAG: hypothetical protein ACREQT_01105 [Candidatus Binataceae bacterium]